MHSFSENNKRIAKNTVYLYIRTFFVLIIALYTSRILLKSLGETDLGVYNLVGGIVALLAFFETAQAKATSRFITYDLGSSSSSEKLSNTYAVCYTIHIMIAIVVLILAETIGLWVVNNMIFIPTDRQMAANIVYQCAIVTFCMQIARVPLTSVIVAYEEMSVYAYLSIAEILLQFLAVVSLSHINFDSLILYGLLLTTISGFMFLLYWAYIRVRHPIYKFSLIWDGTFSKRILSFSGWTIVGTTANTATHQGLALLLNNFVGLVANAALGFANQVNGAVSKFVGSFTTAFNPQIVKLYAQNDLKSLRLMINRASKFSFILAYLMTLPIISNMDYLLGIWLDNVPQYTCGFCQLILVCATIDATTGCYNTTITATGKIRWYQICISISFLLDIMLSYILLVLNFNPILVFSSRILTRGLLNMIIGIYFVHKYVLFNVISYVKSVLIPICCTITITVLCEFAIKIYVHGMTELFVSILNSFITIGICSWILIFSSHEREAVKTFLLKLVKRMI